MSGPRFAIGLSMILFVFVVNSLIAIVNTDSPDGSTSIAGCNATGNSTSNATFNQCQNTSKTSFLNSLFSVTVHGIPGLPLVINVPYVVLMGAILIGGIILVVISFGPTLGY